MTYNKLYGILLDCSYENKDNGESIIQVYVSTEKGIEKLEDDSFKPYFYAISKEPNNTAKEIEKYCLSQGIKISTEIVERQNEKGAIKIVFMNTKDLTIAREFLEQINGVSGKREYDIPFTNRYLIDKGLKPMHGVEIEHLDGKIKKIKNTDVKHELRIAALDLETYSPGRFSDPKKDPVLMACLSTNDCTKVYTSKKTNLNNVFVLPSEKELLEKVLADIREMQPDILVTYNGDSFDLPYIKDRCENLGVKCDFGFGGVRVVKNGMYKKSEINGTQHLDAFVLLKFMVRIGAINILKFDIENVSEKLFGKEKEKLKPEKINELWDKNEIDKIIEYNREDGEVTLKLAMEFLPLQIQLCGMLRQVLSETSRMSSSQMVEQLLIIKSFEQKSLIPNKPTEAEVSRRLLQTFEGGFVKSPVPGLHENIAVLDFRSLHPTIIISHNISPETLKCQHESCKNGKNVSPDKDWFCEKQKGFLPCILEEILKDRIELKKKAKLLDKNSSDFKTINARQHALKILLNSHYGYLGYAQSRWYSRECARAVTAWSRQYIQQVSNEAEKNGFKVLYNDTDSCFLIIPKEKNEKSVRDFVEKINSELPEAMELEIEGFYKRGIFVTKESGDAAKKKYALIDYNGNLKIVGFEYVRRDWAPIAKETQKAVIEAILKEGNPEKAISITKETIRKLKEGKVPKKELVITKQIKASPSKYELIGPHIAAAKKAKERGKKIDVGSMISFIITKNGKSISDKAEMEEYVKEGDYDADYYINNQILQAVLKIMRELDYDKEDLIHGGKQSKLF